MLLSAFAAAFKLRWLVVIAGLGLGLFAGLRGPSVGPDTIVYYKHFISQEYSTSNIGGFEKGYSSIEYPFLLSTDLAQVLLSLCMRLYLWCYWRCF